MLFERFEDPVLSHYSYAVGCPNTGEAAIIDPRRDIDVYLDWAKEEGVRITHVLETHIHADFASGARELAELVDARHHVSGYDRDEVFEVQFHHDDMFDGDEIQIGPARIVAMHTPGHTPEHLSFLVYDTKRTNDLPMLFLTGDFLFVGSLGRPDLLGEEAKRDLANQLFESVQKLADLPDGLEVHPAHGAGSMCGAGMSGRPYSTLGYERIANPYLDPSLDRETFVAKILGSVPPFPDYYRRMKQVNSDGAPILGDMPGADHPMSADEVQVAQQDGAVVIDLRDQLSYGGGHIPESFGIGLRSLAMWASWMVPYDRPIVLVGDEETDIENAVRELVRVGLDDVLGYLDGGIDAYVEAGYDLHELPQISPHELAEALRDDPSGISVLDVRADDEFEDGHVEGAVHIHAGYVPDQLGDVPNGSQKVAVMCRTGYRSTVAASVLRRLGREHIINVAGGMDAWRRAGLPIAR